MEPLYETREIAVPAREREVSLHAFDPKFAYIQDGMPVIHDKNSNQVKNTVAPEEEIRDRVIVYNCLNDIKMYPDYWHRGTPHVVGVSMHLYFVNKIDTVAQTFDAGIFINYEWQPSKCDIARYKELQREGRENEFVPDFVPQIRHVNCLAHTTYTKEEGMDGAVYTMLQNGKRDSRGHLISMKQDYMIYMRENLRGTFGEPFELRRFPFDVQDLKIILRSVASTKKQILVPSLRLTTFGQISMDISSLPDWEYETAVGEFGLSDPSLSIGGLQYSNFTLNVKVSRDYMAYVLRVNIMMMLISGTMFTVFSLDPIEDAAERQANSFSLLLTALVFMFVVASQLPTVPYLTILDQYVYIMFVFMLAIAIECAVITQLNTPHYYDKYCFFAFLGLFALLHIYYIFKSWRARRFEKKRLRRTSKQSQQLEDDDWGNNRTFYLDSDGLQEPNSDYWARIDNTSTLARLTKTRLGYTNAKAGYGSSFSGTPLVGTPYTSENDVTLGTRLNSTFRVVDSTPASSESRIV